MTAKQTPLFDLLRAVPADARLSYEHSTTEYSMIPVGRLCAEAADALEAQQAEIASLHDGLAATALRSADHSCKAIKAEAEVALLRAARNGGTEIERLRAALSEVLEFQSAKEPPSIHDWGRWRRVRDGTPDAARAALEKP